MPNFLNEEDIGMIADGTSFWRKMTEGKVENRTDLFSRLPSEPLEWQREGKRKISETRLCLTFSLKSGSFATNDERSKGIHKTGILLKKEFLKFIRGNGWVTLDIDLWYRYRVGREIFIPVYIKKDFPYKRKNKDNKKSELHTSTFQSYIKISSGLKRILFPLANSTTTSLQ